MIASIFQGFISNRKLVSAHSFSGEGTVSPIFLPQITELACDSWHPGWHSHQAVSTELAFWGGVWLSFLGPLCSSPCNNATSPWYTLPHLFSQHACEVGRGRDCPRFTEEEVEAHRGQVTCPRSQTAAKLEMGPGAGPWFTWGSPPCSKRQPRGCLGCQRGAYTA